MTVSLGWEVFERFQMRILDFWTKFVLCFGSKSVYKGIVIALNSFYVSKYLINKRKTGPGTGLLELQCLFITRLCFINRGRWTDIVVLLFTEDIVAEL